MDIRHLKCGAGTGSERAIMGTSLKKVAKKAKEYKYVLLAMRHAKTEPFGGNGSDVGRELTDKGRKQAKAVAKGLAAFKMVPTRIACSSATRARQTCDRMLKVFGDDPKVDYRQSLYEGGAQSVFDEPRIAAGAEGVRHVASLPDPVGEIERGYTLENGLRLNQVHVPIGVIGMIYEARPNVTVDVASLCLKSGNAAILRGGHDAERTNAATMAVIHDALAANGFDPALIDTVDEYGREGATAMMEARGHIDVLIPRGGAGLIQAVVRNSKVPVIETGAGNVHIYVDRSGDLDKAIPIIINAKTQRVGVCNAVEKLLVHRDVAERFLPAAAKALADKGVELHADERAFAIIEAAGIPSLAMKHATDQDWDTEYLALTMGVKIVDSLDEAIDSINMHSTGHTESIISEDYSAIETFAKRIDSAVVMVNASTRFTDGGVFGFGAELGISTQKMHARGPNSFIRRLSDDFISNRFNP